MIKTQGPAGSNAKSNAKLTIIKDYIEKSEACDYNDATVLYSMNSKDLVNMWSVGGVNVGYEVLASPLISLHVIDSGNYIDLSFMVMEYSNENGQVTPALSVIMTSCTAYTIPAIGT